MRRRHRYGVSLPSGTAVSGLLVLALLAGCTGGESDLQGPNVQEPYAPVAVQRALVVSEPVPQPPGGPQAGSGAAAAVRVAFVSLPPGQVPKGEQVTISNRATGASQTAPVIDDGFDPVQIPAVAGDTLDVVIQRVGLQPFHIIIIVPSRRPPIVVRTEPPKRKLDVPLSVAPYVVFSEPMAEATVTPASVRLLRSGVLEQGTVTLSADGLRATFEPEQPLRGETEYVLQVTTDVTDVSGDPLEATLDVEFTTEPGPVPVGAVTVWPDSATLVPGAWVQLRATVGDTAGNVVTDRAVRWTTSDSAVAIVAENSGLVRTAIDVPVAEPGRTVTITATSDGVAGTAVIKVGRVTFTSVEAGKFHVCALTATGQTYCWGNDYHGHLALGFAAPDGCRLAYNGTRTCVDRPHLVPATSSPELASLSSGQSFTCGLAPDGAAYCWGEIAYGNLGNGQTGTRGHTVGPVPVTGGRSYVSISSGLLHSCALTPEGEAFCWGWNASGQLGDNTTTDRADPVPVVGEHRFSAISAGRYHTCGVTADGTGLCWGTDSFGQLGDAGGRVDHSAPVVVAGGLRFTDVSAGWNHTCGLIADGTAYCWGSNGWGRLGDGTVTPSTMPVPVAGGLTFVSVDAGSTHTCARTSSGAAYCWGQNQYGQLGDGTTTDSWTPVAVTGGHVFRSLSVGFGLVSNFGDGYGYTCGLASDSGAYCWGSGATGSLGDGAGGQPDRSSPVLVIGSR